MAADAGGAGAVGRPGAAGLTDASVGAPLPADLSIAWSRARSRAASGAFAAGLAAGAAATLSGALDAPVGGPACGLRAAAFSGAGLLPPNASRSRRATGASTVDEADLTNSPCSFSRARTSLLVTPSSLANSCTRALPATTSPVYEATDVGRASVLAMTHGHRDFTVCSCSLLPLLLPGGTNAPRESTCSTTADVSGEPVMRSALVKARRRIACCTHCCTGCNQAPRPGRLLAVSTITA
ncbi:MAG: hypothetical protein QOG37_1776 [Mycobacterium sp.]|nr:hypothetical protein [Mycobacterium sp.]